MLFSLGSERYSEVGTRRDDVGDVAFDVWHLPFLLHNNNRVFFSSDESRKIAVQRDSRDTGKQGVGDGVLKDGFTFTGELDVQKFGDFFGFPHFEFVIC